MDIDHAHQIGQKPEEVCQVSYGTITTEPLGTESVKKWRELYRSEVWPFHVKIGKPLSGWPRKVEIAYGAS